MEVNRKEVERYLGYRGLTTIDEKMQSVIEDCIREMEEAMTPRCIYKTFPIEWDGESCEFAGIRVEPGNLTRNLKGCKEIVMLAVTIGPGADRLVKRSEIRDMLKAYTYQAVGAAAVEAWCDEVNERIKQEPADKGLYTRPRFSPGYGDFPLEVQKDFERILEMPKSIGVSLSESLLMTPTKSITAVIGLSDRATDCHRAGCEECNMHETCEYSRA